MSILDMIEDFTMGAGDLETITLARCIIAMLVALVIGVLIYFVYKAFYSGVLFSRNFGIVIIGVTIVSCMAAMAAGSNIMLAVCLLGVLSVVKGRSELRDPIDLFYLFWAASTGIAVGAQIYLLAVIAFLIIAPVIALFNAVKVSSKIYMVIIHYSGDIENEVLQGFGNIKYQIKSKTIHSDTTELALEVFCPNGDTSFTENIKAIEGVEDLTMVQYDGEYHG